MANKIGFMAKLFEEQQKDKPAYIQTVTAPKRSVVQVYFPGQNKKLAYYNDQFDLHCGDLVYVDGKLEGIRGRIIDISYNFKIKASDYKRVIAVVDTNVKGEFYMAGSHFITFNPSTLPVRKASLWFMPPDAEEYIFSSDDTSFPLHDLKQMNISPTIAERGHDYYMENKVRYICIDGEHGYAIVDGTKAYAVQFEYRDGEISNLICDCPCVYTCKHAFATMLQLKETLSMIEKHYQNEYSDSQYFAAISKASLFAFAVDGKETGSFIL